MFTFGWPLSVVALLGLCVIAFGLAATDRTVVFDPSVVRKDYKSKIKFKLIFTRKTSVTFDDVSPLSLFPLIDEFERLAFSSLSLVLFSSFDNSFLLFIELVDVRDSIRSLKISLLYTN